MTVEQTAKELQMSKLFLREWIATGNCPFGVCVQFKGSKKRTFHIDEERMKKWRQGKL